MLCRGVCCTVSKPRGKSCLLALENRFKQFKGEIQVNDLLFLIFISSTLQQDFDLNIVQTLP